MAKMITLDEAKDIVRSKAVFDMQFVTADENRKTGGRRLIRANLSILGEAVKDRKNGAFTVSDTGSADDKVFTVHWDLVEQINGVEVLI